MKSYLHLITILGTCVTYAADQQIKKEIRVENGKQVEYMFIDGIKVHEENPALRPQPEIVTPQAYDEVAAKAPAGATILFDGSATSLENWSGSNQQPTKWILADGALQCVAGSGFIQTKQQYGSCRLHVEFATPAQPNGTGQGRGNSGVFLQGIYEVQILDSYKNT
jgi:Domain of Unknown Function (DUF1080)